MRMSCKPNISKTGQIKINISKKLLSKKMKEKILEGKKIKVKLDGWE